jgi:hypothetical protein
MEERKWNERASKNNVRSQKAEPEELEIDDPKVIYIIFSPSKGYNPITLTDQKYFLAKIFPYIFHIKPLIFITFSADFHEIFPFNSRIIRVYEPTTPFLSDQKNLTLSLNFCWIIVNSMFLSDYKNLK